MAEAMTRRFVQRHGRHGLYFQGVKLRSWHKKNADAMAHAMARASEVNRGRSPTQLQEARRRLGLLSLEPRGRFGLCLLCGRLTFTPDAQIRRASRRSG